MDINVQFSDIKETAIAAYFGSPQSEDIPNTGRVAATDARWAAFYETLPAVTQAMLPQPE